MSLARKHLLFSQPYANPNPSPKYNYKKKHVHHDTATHLLSYNRYIY